VVTECGHALIVVAYYAGAWPSITPAAAPLRLQKGAGRYPSPLPCWLAWGLTFTMRSGASVPLSAGGW